jgi:hypothetical protein
MQIKRGSDSDRQGVVPLAGELFYSTDTKEVYVGDGTTSGGVPITSGGEPGPAGPQGIQGPTG